MNERGYSVDTLSSLRAEDTTVLPDGFTLLVRRVNTGAYHGLAYTYTTFPNIPSDAGTILIRPNSGTGYWAAPVGYTHFDTAAPPATLHGVPLLWVFWWQFLSSPSRILIWAWDGASWQKSGPPVVASGAPGFTGDFQGQLYVNSSNGDTYSYSTAGGWRLLT